MKKSILLFFGFILISTLSSAQGITGDWYGALDIYGQSLKINFHIDSTDNGFSSTMDSPDQQAYGIPVDKTQISGDSVFLKINQLNVVYKGKINRDKQEISGSFLQNGAILSLNMTRNPVKAEIPKRPQEPKPPYPYNVEEVTFYNKIGEDTLAGTLTRPKTGNNFPAVVLITGSGAQDRNEEILGHKPFLVIADYLTRHGIAVLRYDDRGTAESTGSFAGSTTADFATDAAAAFNYLKTRPEINAKKIGLMGHSEGGAIAPMVAVHHQDVDFIVLLAGPGVKGSRVILKQQELIGKASGVSEKQLTANKKVNSGIYRILNQVSDSMELRKNLKRYLKKSMEKYPILQENSGLSKEKYLEVALSTYTNPWWRYFLTYDPAPTLKKVSCPVLALNGSHDLQVPADQNLPALKKALEEGGNKQVTLLKLKGLNHLFQESETGSPAEYGKIEQTFSPKALKIIKDWILKQSAVKNQSSN